MRIEGSHILITGGSLGIGKATAKLLIEAGAKVAITGRNASRVEAAAKELGALAIVADVSSEADVKRTYSEFFAAFPRLDALVNNAGIGEHRELAGVTVDSFRAVWETNVLGAALMAREAAEAFKTQQYGNIVNIASTSGLRGYESGTMYVASKFALRGMTECWRAELRKHNVRVMLVNPSEVTTAFGSRDGIERPEKANKLRSVEIAHAIKGALEMDDRGFITDLTVFATNPF
ncbi:MAG: SDR family oxidoreductase [Ignavibacteria bacterium]|nr:SDR family oxidoreductase [Ignavibacteria bacterium]